MKTILAVFVACMFLLVLTSWLAINGYPFYIWVPVLIPAVPYGQYWLMTRPVKLPPNRTF